MADFGTLNFSVAFKPTGAFPINANQYFESLDEARAAAASAEEVGSTNTVYHYGMKLLVSQDGADTWYTILRDGTLSAEGTTGPSEVVLVIPKKYDELKELLNNSALVAGSLYRITDYATATTQEATQSAGHQFDILVQALTASTLAEEAKAIHHDGDEYFSNSNLNGWQLWYTIDNDTNRFAWADAENGKGVIYRLIDEWGNECPYDFKNIMMQNPLDADDSGYYYTFDNAGGDLSLIGELCFSNHIDKYIDGAQKINRIIFIAAGLEVSGNSFDTQCYNNVFRRATRRLSFARECYGNNFLGHNHLSTFDTKFRNNTVGGETQSIQVGQGATNNVFANNIYYCSFGNYFKNNVLCSYLYYSTFGHYIQNCILGESAELPGQYMRFLTFENNVTYLNLYKADTATKSYLENVTISSGTCGSSAARIMLLVEELAQKYAITFGLNTKGIVEKYCAADLPSSANNSGGVSFKTDETLSLVDGVLSVNTANSAEEDNTKPITSAAVHTQLGNIEALLQTI